jgi:hypothetical protein
MPTHEQSALLIVSTLRQIAQELPLSRTWTVPSLVNVQVDVLAQLNVIGASTFVYAEAGAAAPL